MDLMKKETSIYLVSNVVQTMNYFNEQSNDKFLVSKAMVHFAIFCCTKMCICFYSDSL